MPARSRRQQRYLFANFGPAWVRAHHFDKLAPGAPTDPTLHAVAEARKTVGKALLASRQRPTKRRH